MSEHIDTNSQKTICRAYLICIFDGEKYLISGDRRFNIGRKIADYDEIDLSIDESIVSRNHAAIIQENNQFFLIDTESKNGTYLNGNKLNVNKKYSLKDNDIVEFSKIKYRFERKADKEEKCCYDFGDVVLLDVYEKRRLCIELFEGKKIITYQYKMIQYNHIDGLLSMAVMNNEERCRIYYDIDKKESLASLIHTKGYLSKSEFIKISMDIFEVINNARKYLLNPEGLLLECRFIFFDHNEKKTFFVYRPFEITNKGSLKTFISKIATYMSNEEEFQIRVLKEISKECFNLNDFKTLILNEQEWHNISLDAADSLEEPVPERLGMLNKIKGIIENPNTLVIILIQAAMVLITGFVIMSRVLEIYQYIGFLITVTAIDIGLIYKYLPSIIRNKEKGKENGKGKAV